jgi:hypothetical protein
MEKIYLFVFLYLAGFSLYGQRGNGGLIHEPVLKTDQIIAYIWDIEKSEWVIKNSIKYNYTYINGEAQAVTTSDYFTGVPISQIIYSYTPEMILKESLYQNWVSGIWKSTRRDLWFSNDEGLTVEALIQFWQNNTWVNSIRYIDYQYDNRQLLQYTYQTWTKEQWIDSFYDTWNFDDSGNLVLRLSIGLNGTPITKITYLVGEKNLRQNLTVYNWINGIWVENYRRLYEYNQCGRLTEVVYQLFKAGNWINSTRQKYIYSLYTGNIKSGVKVPVCHNGHTIYISINAVEAHLAHGDCIGECTVEKKDEKQGCDEKEKHETPPFTVYPNPAKERIIIKFDKDEDFDSKRVELTDFYGKLIKSFNIKGNSELTIYRDNLLSGKYYVRLVGKEVYSVVVIFE